jgi:hypothetical protein
MCCFVFSVFKINVEWCVDSVINVFKINIEKCVDSVFNVFKINMKKCVDLIFSVFKISIERYVVSFSIFSNLSFNKNVFEINIEKCDVFLFIFCFLFSVFMKSTSKNVLYCCFVFMKQTSRNVSWKSVLNSFNILFRFEKSWKVVLTLKNSENEMSTQFS